MRFLFILFAISSLSACSWFTEPVAASATPYGILVAADVVSMIDTQKSLGDHVVSAYTGKDCSSYRYYQQNKPYCVEVNPEPEQELNEEPLFCYNSMIGVNCYTSPVYGPSYINN